MNFCILVELSKKKISFLYNRSDGGSKFTPFVGDGQALPLAIYCLGNDIQIGQFAIEEALNHSPYAYTDVFDVIKIVGTYKYKGNEYHFNTLLKNAIEKYLAYFFDNTLIGQMGRLEQNIATMPLCFVFNADVGENERLFVKDCFEKGGYGNLAIIDYDQIVVEASALTTNYAVLVTSDGEDLYISLYETKTHKFMGSAIMQEKGKDPRVDAAVQNLWESLGYGNYYLSLENERRILTQIAEDFLSSGKLELQENVLFSDGVSRECFLSMRELSNYRYNDDGKIIVDIKSTLAKLNISPLDCTIVLKGKAANNGYFKHIFINEFNSLVNVDDSFHAKVLSQLLKDIKLRNYSFTSKSTTSKSLGGMPVINPTPTLKRYVKTKIAEIKGKQRSKDINGALNLANDLLKELHDKELTYWDVEINSLLSDLKLEDTPPPPDSLDRKDKTSGKIDLVFPATPKVNSKEYQREVKTAIANAKGKKRAGDINGAQSIIFQLEQKLHNLDVHVFDDEISKAKDDIGVIPKQTPGKNEKEDKKGTKQLSKVELLLSSGKFAEAKKEFASEGNSQMAQICSELIKSKRTIALYKSGFESVKRNNNKTTISNTIRDLERLYYLYKQYAIDASEIELLINNYKSV